MVLDIKISPVRRGTKNCVDVEGSAIIFEMFGMAKQSIIEEAVVGIISHETVESLLLDSKEMKEHPTATSIHDLIGSGQKTEDYVGNTDGIVLGKQ